jgi:hypothetical protein
MHLGTQLLRMRSARLPSHSLKIEPLRQFPTHPKEGPLQHVMAHQDKELFGTMALRKADQGSAGRSPDFVKRRSEMAG